MTPKKIYIRFASAEKLCEKSSDGEATMKVKTYPGRCDMCYTQITWGNAYTSKPAAGETILYRDENEGMHLLKVDPKAVDDWRTWDNLVHALKINTWTYTHDLI